MTIWASFREAYKALACRIAFGLTPVLLMPVPAPHSRCPMIERLDRWSASQAGRIYVRGCRFENVDGPMTAAEIGETVFRHQRVQHGAREWTGSALKSLERKGLVDKLGISSSGGRCWTITPAGRAALAKEPAQEEGR